MIRVGVVRGGISHKYNESLQSGAAVLQVLRDHFPMTYKPVDILITKDGTWHIAGRPINSDQLQKDVDVVWNALHGSYGEDGGVQDVLDVLGVPYTGSGPVASAIVHTSLKDRARELEIKTADEYVVPDYRSQVELLPEVYLKEHAQNIFLKFSPPWNVKHREGETVHAKTRGELLEALRIASEKPGDIVVEEHTNGKQASVLIADNFRGKELYCFLPVGEGLSAGQKGQLEKCAQQLHKDLGLRHFSEMHFNVTPKHVYLSKVSVSPGLNPQSSVLAALQSVGSHLPDFVDHVIQMALRK